MNADEALNVVFGEGLDGDFPLPDPFDSECSDSAEKSDPDFEPESSWCTGTSNEKTNNI